MQNIKYPAYSCRVLKQPKEIIKMARPLRVEYSGACYHVVGRGNRRIQIFSSDSDYILFLDKLAGYVELYGEVIYTYCLMPNHYHLFLKINHANLGKFMQSLITSFSIIWALPRSRIGLTGHSFSRPGAEPVMRKSRITGDTLKRACCRITAESCRPTRLAT